MPQVLSSKQLREELKQRTWGKACPQEGPITSCSVTLPSKDMSQVGWGPTHLWRSHSTCTYIWVTEGVTTSRYQWGKGTGRENTIQFIPYNSVVSTGNMGIPDKAFESRNNSNDSTNFSSIHWYPWSLSGLRFPSVKVRNWGVDWELGISRFKLVYVGWINNKVLCTAQGTTFNIL